MTRPRRQSCAQCHGEFAVSEKAVSLLEKVSPGFAGVTIPIPPPVLCPACREGSRLAFRNEWKMYRRQCDATGKSLVSIYRDDSPYRVVDPQWWWSDAYDPLDYGRDFDFSRSFFEQFHELNLAVPKSAIQNAKSENADYTNYS